MGNSDRRGTHRARRWLIALLGLTLVAVGGLPAQASFTQSGVKTSSLAEWLPAADEGYFAWSHNSTAHPKHDDYFVEPTGESPYRVNSADTLGFGGGIDGTTLIYQEVNARRTDSNLKLYDLSSKTRSNPASGVNSSLWEWAPTISGDWILFGRNKFDRLASPWKVILFNTSTSETRVLDFATYRCRCIFPGQVAGDYATWSKCTGGRCQVFLHTISSNTSERLPNPYTKQQYFGSPASDGTIYFVRSGDNCGQNVKIVSWVSGGPDAGTVIASLLIGKDLTFRTYVNTDGSDLDHVYYDRYVCRTGAMDILVLDEQAGGRPWVRTRSTTPSRVSGFGNKPLVDRRAAGL